jgi:predicted branched-subunit amino acid permease
MSSVTHLALGPEAVAKPAGVTRRELRRGAATMAPLLAGYAPLGVLVGTAAAAAPDPAAGWASIFVVYGGSAQLTCSRLLTDGAALATIVVTCLLIQARLLVYSASLAPHWRGRSRRWRVAAAATVIDPTWAMAHARQAEGGSDEAAAAHYVGAAATLTAGWTVFVTAGLVLGARLPASATLDVVAPLALLALIAPQLVDAGTRRAAAAAVATVVLAARLPAGVPVLLAMAAGTAAARTATNEGAGR